MVTKQDADLSRADSLAREIFSDVANKWAFLIIETLGDRTLRFSELRDLDGVRRAGPPPLRRARRRRGRPGRPRRVRRQEPPRLPGDDLRGGRGGRGERRGQLAAFR